MSSLEKLQQEAKYQYVRAEAAIKVGFMGRALTEAECVEIIKRADTWMDTIMEQV